MLSRHLTVADGILSTLKELCCGKCNRFLFKRLAGNTLRVYSYSVTAQLPPPLPPAS
jgi:hypothetical protein